LRPASKQLNIKAYAFALKWIEDNGYQVTEPARESYIDGIWNQETDADWLTELQFPVVKNRKKGTAWVIFRPRPCPFLRSI
jgi:hypothetical protein